MKTYKVYITEPAFVYKVKADTKGEAELKAMQTHNGGDWSEDYKVDVTRLKNVKI